MRELFLTGTEAYIRWIELPGDGPVRVFVHGLGCTAASDFAHIAAHPALGGGRALLVDLLGHGLSDRPADFDYRMESQAAAVAALLDHLGVTAVDLVGHSMGGAVAIHLAAARPDLVARLVVAEPNLYAGGGAFSTPVAAQDESAFVTEGFARMVAGTDRPDYAARLRLAGPLAVHRSAVALVEGSTPAPGDLLATLDAPRTYLVGELSLPDPDAEKAAALGVPVVEIPRAGHNLMLDNPEGFATALGHALTEPPARAN
ncbi:MULTISPECIES: alpha/beta hydrolase [unclassified Streptomyces]|uniref:alpha/beta fold hydrolase n=1 Tax=unclassified Streptomyces TaxID=2593676 RepID=UPI0006FA9D5D|nr:MULTISPECIES: alpha/beta hydrolase [unclassified Streptomyces]KQX46163.1 hydrolase [Streptomyces sp. Root1304]KRA80948.1 hydrolase [Streptomyces sp. Root66D1]